MSAVIRLNNQVNATENQTFTATSTVQTFTVPAGVFWIRFFLWGAGGIGQNGGINVNSAGGGAFVEGNLRTAPGTVYYIVVGARGRYNITPAIANGGAAGGGTGADGGGFSGIFSSTPSASSVIAIAGGGGGAGFNGNGYGGGGGFPSGGTAQGSSPGGSQSAGGSGSFPGSQLLGGNAGFGGDCCGGGGGGGWYGGGGGNNSQGGGGGSSTVTSIVINPILENGTNGSPTGVAPTPPGGRNSPVWRSPLGSAGQTGFVVIGFNPNISSIPLQIRLNNQVNATANQTFTGTGAVQTFTVPNGVFWIRFFLWGAGGTCQDGSRISRPDAAGSGSYVEGNLRTAPGTVYYIIVGRAGYTGLNNGGGGSGFVGTNGGGFTGIFSGSPAFGNVVAIAGGGGGSGTNNGNYFGGGGGYPSGGNGTGGATGGTQSAGGSGSSSGSQLQGANGGGGGGGGGYYGGGAGTGGNPSTGGGGGSSYYISSVVNPITISGINTATVGTNTRAANESSPLWVSPYGRSGYDGYAVIGFNTNTSSLPIQITLGNVLSSTATAFITDNTTYTIPPKTSKIRIFVWGGGGNGNNYGSSGCGGSGAHVQGDFTVGSITSLTIYLNRGAGPGHFGNNGAGYGAVYNATTGYLLIAGGGGGSGSGYGGGGGYLQGFSGGSPSIAGQVSVQSTAIVGSGGGGGSQTQGGDGARSAGAGSYLQGGSGEMSAYPSGGGGGYYGGGGGNGNGAAGLSGNGPGGGGSSYINMGYIKNYMGFDGQSGSTSSVLPGGASSPYYVPGYGVGGRLTNGGSALVVIVPYIS